ncbi:MAG TPA: YraN family protein [Fervidobacterium sp.]|jgi:putative endonuclease|nr:YraN family protein [Fervidobacterium sp.]NLH36541.1 YraN family protein [Thermotogaceae bacterium]MBP8657394.1 YraN family protein [Fervidobacterium sp.]MBP9518536.1 YraN family protein [Fervidobacterium sp.]HOH52683.1 YraN family protein [Fervidobacterium sp.]
MGENNIDWKQAEQMVIDFLKRDKKYKIVAHNYKTSFGEIDIIAQQGDTYIFIEVKSGTGKRVRPSERVDVEKYRKISTLAEYFLRDKRYSRARIDVAEVIDGEINYYEDVGWEFG